MTWAQAERRPPLLQLRDIALTLGGAPLLDGAELSISPGDRIALVGRNGSGKSTLMRIAAGELAPDRERNSRSRRPGSPICLKSPISPGSRPRSTMCSRVSGSTTTNIPHAR